METRPLMVNGKKTDKCQMWRPNPITFFKEPVEEKMFSFLYELHKKLYPIQKELSYKLHIPYRRGG